MDITIGAKVQCADGPCGHVTYVVINPLTREVTHLVVKEPAFARPERLVSVSDVVSSTPHEIALRCTKQELEAMERFIDTEFIPVNHTHRQYAPSDYWVWPYAVPYRSPEANYIQVEHEHVPPHELAVRRGAQVEARDGHVGQVNEFLVDPKNGHITHLVLREGHLWGKRDVTIPVSEIRRIDEDTVRLKLSKVEIGALPAIPVQRWWE